MLEYHAEQSKAAYYVLNDARRDAAVKLVEAGAVQRPTDEEFSRQTFEVKSLGSVSGADLIAMEQRSLGRLAKSKQRRGTAIPEERSPEDLRSSAFHAAYLRAMKFLPGDVSVFGVVVKAGKLRGIAPHYFDYYLWSLHGCIGETTNQFYEIGALPNQAAVVDAGLAFVDLSTRN